MDEPIFTNTFIGLAIISLISATWIRHTTFENRLELMEFLADETVYRLTDATNPNNGPINGIPGFIGIASVLI